MMALVKQKINNPLFGQIRAKKFPKNLPIAENCDSNVCTFSPRKIPGKFLGK
jgi:hypothetical protein